LLSYFKLDKGTCFPVMSSLTWHYPQNNSEYSVYETYCEHLIVICNIP